MNLSDYISRNYNELRRYAGAFTRDPNDLIHHTFVKMHDAGFIYINDQMTDYYFKRSMKNNATRGDFKKQYKIDHEQVENIPEEHDIDRRIAIEKVDVVLRHLDYFDRTIFELYLRGENMTKLSKESGIPISTIYHTLSQVRQIIKDNV